MAGGDRTQQSVVFADDRAGCLGVDPSLELRRADEVGEEDRHDPAGGGLARVTGGVAQWVAAGAAEPRGGAGLGSTGETVPLEHAAALLAEPGVRRVDGVTRRADRTAHDLAKFRRPRRHLGRYVDAAVATPKRPPEKSPGAV